MYMKPTLLILLASLSGTLPAQRASYCDGDWCTLRKDHPAHFDPYYNGHLCENFNPKQNDFSREYLRLQSSQGGADVAAGLADYDLSAIWPTINGQQNGVIGLDYTRIRIHISTAVRDGQEKLRYHVKGKSNVKGNVCDFTGTIRLIRAYAGSDDSEHEHSGRLYAEYTFHEDKTQKHVGTFQGIFECFYYLDPKTKKAYVDESSDIADGYYNRTYVGTWKGYHSTVEKKCIWGDYRLPFTFDFDCGDGEMVACEQYEKNGWEAYNKGEEFEIADGKRVLRDRWW